MKRKKFSNDGEMKKLLNELSTQEAVKVKGGNSATTEEIKEISIGITIKF